VRTALIDALGAATCGHHRALAGPAAAGIDLFVLCATWGVPGVGDGLHRHNPLTGALDPIWSGPAGAGELVPGADPAEVAAVAIVVGGLASAVDRHGDDGHRRLLVAAGALTAALADAGSRRSIPCCEVAQVFPGVLRDRAAVDGYRWTALSAVVFGHPWPTRSPDRPLPLERR
jgi:hypothetical protein